jgi:hypothetical protein
MGGWLLAALVLIALNAFRFITLEYQPLVGNSPTVKLLQTKLQQFDRTLAAGVFSFKDRIDLLGAFNASSKNRKSKDDRSVSEGQDGSQSQAGRTTGLPSLSGIIHILDPLGSVYYQAVLNGQVCREKDKIADFTVVKISPGGVVIRRSGREWTIEGPTPYFSSDQGD